jgi:hypothetical protein
MNNEVRVWRFYDTPDHIAKLAPSCGGDEDWIVAGEDKDMVHEVAEKLAVCEKVMREIDFLGRTFWIATCVHA